MSKGRLRVSPNEEARLLKEERDKRRKLRIIQVGDNWMQFFSYKKIIILKQDS